MKTNQKKDNSSKSRLLMLILLIAFSIPTILQGQNSNYDKYSQKCDLKEVVILSRHNIRAPLSTSGSVLGQVTTKKWVEWTANGSELTLKGGVLETIMGQYFRKWAEAYKLFPENYCPNVDEFNVYANCRQRTISTAKYFTTGFFPTCNIDVYHRYTSGKLDPTLNPRLTKVTDDFKIQAMKEINAMGGEKGLYGLSESLKPSYDLVAKVVDMENSPLYKTDKTCRLNDYNTPIKFKANSQPKLSGSLNLANKIADALILQYYEEPDDIKAGFGQKLTYADWENISKIKDVYGDVLFAAPIVAINVAHPVLVYMKDELLSSDRKFTYLVAHDSNICALTNALNVENYSLPNTIEKKTPIGCKFVIEKWQDRESKKVYANVSLVYQTTDQLRQTTPLSLTTPPAIYQLQLKGLQKNELGLYDFNDLIARFNEAISAYENIK